MTVRIRRYEPRDREAIRQLACDTADRGAPVERFFPDRGVIADLLTAYYTDYEPDATWVADTDGVVIGYVTGCVDTRRCQRISACRIIPGSIWRGVQRGALSRRETWQILRMGWRTFWRGGYNRTVSLAEYPAHLHLNIREGFRGQGIASQLMARFLEQARQARRRGVHASVRGDNAPACRFFERMGFSAIGRYPLVLPEDPDDRPHETVIYGKSLS
ncbi:MAG: GNAT family N-acetyltransferase [Candidatus Omnitrophica bacterium]|nr:GNAT family N-acetyltransferase [Candidatus Omnitrophota bacterium]